MHQQDESPYTLLITMSETPDGQILVSADDAQLVLKNYARARCGNDALFLAKFNRFVDGAFDSIKASSRE